MPRARDVEIIIKDYQDRILMQMDLRTLALQAAISGPGDFLQCSVPVKMFLKVKGVIEVPENGY